MGAAKEHRDRQHFQRQFNRDVEAANRRLDLRLKGAPLRWEDERAELVARAEAAERELGRARRCVRRLSLTLTEERARARAAVAEAERTRAELLGTGPTTAHFYAILMLSRVRRALGYEAE